MKAYLSSVLEDLVGEYVINISKENLKLAALRGQIKLENVELDGDVIGSHVLGAVGLPGFGVLSCWARTLKIKIPWTNLDAPTSLEIHGMHLVCVPLLPTTVNRTYYGGQNLQTKAKRSALARFERNYFSGRIHGEGPLQEFYQNDLEIPRFIGRRQGSHLSEDVGNEDDLAAEDSLASYMNDNSQDDTGRESTPAKKAGKTSSGLSALKKKVTSKVYENLVSSISDVHIRCEVPGEGLATGSLPKMGNPTSDSIDDGRAFAFGLTLKCLSVRNMPESSFSDRTDIMSRFDQSHSGAADSSDDGKKTFKKAEIEDLAFYWDDDPCYLISESALLQGRLSLPVEKSQRRIAKAMKLMMKCQDPGFDSIASLSDPCLPARCSASEVGHEYICSHISQAMIITTATDELGNSLCFREILPSTINLNITSQQYEQYQLLKNAVLSQQRFDTMFHRRPQNSPIIAPREWWRYAVACVKHKPTSRSWDEVQQIVSCREQYLRLAVKNLLNTPGKGGFHGGLTDDESHELSQLEYTLPVEALLSFHLLALRRVFATRQVQTISNNASHRVSRVNSFTVKRSSSTFGRLFNTISGSNSLKFTQEVSFNPISSPECTDHQLLLNQKKKSTSREKVVTAQTACHLHICKMRVNLIDKLDGRLIVTAEFDVGGTSYISGTGKADVTCNIMRFEAFDFITCDNETSGWKVLAIEPSNQDVFECRSDFLVGSIDGSYTPKTAMKDDMFERAAMRLPPKGVACQITALLEQISLSLEIRSHPATLVWSKACADRVSDFFMLKTHQIHHQFLQKLRIAATPDAQKAHMAVFYPNSLTIDVAVHAPMLWIPVSPQLLDGALFVDTGKFRLLLKKPEESTDTNWNLDVADIQIMLAGDPSCAAMGEIQNVAADLDGMSVLRRKLITVVHPFEVRIVGQTNGSFQEHVRMGCTPEVYSRDSYFPAQSDEGTGQMISVKVSHIRVNLIDVEVLAKAIGRFYVSGVGMMKNNSSTTLSDCIAGHNRLASQGPGTSAFESINVCLEKVEAALERYSSKRTYFIEIYEIKLDKRNQGNLSFSRMSVGDFSIVQLTDVSSNQFGSTVRYLTPSCEPQHRLLGRRQMTSDHHSVGVADTPPASPRLTTQQTPKIQKRPPQSPLRTPTRLRVPSQGSPVLCALPSDFIRGCHYHDGSKHVDEVELDVVSVVLKVTPTSISDCTMWLARAIELISLSSKEMERRVHERGRNARSEVCKDELPYSSNDYGTGAGMLLNAKDSSVIFRVTFSQATILIGRPASEFTSSRGRQPEDYVLLFKTNASIMTQSIEDENDVGSSTLHISLEDFSTAINPDFQNLDLPISLILCPTSIDCRLMYNTFKGRATSQKLSFDCELMLWNLDPHSIRIVTSVVRKVMERLQLLRADSSESPSSILATFVRFREKGTRIASQVQFELRSVSLTVCQSFKMIGLRPFIKFHVSQLKVSLTGCIDAMTGEVSARTQLEFFHPKYGFEDVIQSNRLLLSVDQIPNELVLSIGGPEQININVTEALIQEISYLERTNSDFSGKGVNQAPIRFELVNETEFAVIVGYSGSAKHGQNEHITVFPGTTVSLDSSFCGIHSASTLSLAATDRRMIPNLPLFPSSQSKRCCLLFRWYPKSSKLDESETPRAKIDTSPVVEFVMQNERIRQGVSDVFSLERGQDLLSSVAWSPVSARHEKKTQGRTHSDLLWRPPYLDDDARAWSDLTTIIGKKKDDCVLPSKNWIWVSEWEVDIDEDIRKNDADGWEYATDFETFGTTPRSYKPGDLCRRRRWTRTRILNQTKSERVFSIVWDVTNEEKRSITVRSRVQIHNNTNMQLSFFGSCHLWDEDKFIGHADPGDSLCVPLQLASATHVRLAKPKNSQAYGNQNANINDFFSTDKLMILPTSFTSNRIMRSSILCEHLLHGFLSMKKLHFLLTLKCVEGVISLHIDPALRVINLLPCELQCQFGEMGSFRHGMSKISQTEIISLGAGTEGKCLSVDCTLCPHLSVRVPGYKWSCWKKIVNRESNSCTLRLTEEEELALFEKDSAEHIGEFKSVVHFDHAIKDGVSIDIVMSIETGHSPTVRFYAQYWILDKTRLKLNFTGGFVDFMQSTPEKETLRKSHLQPIEVKDRRLQIDFKREGYEWSLGSSGMLLFFSRDEKVSLSVDGETGWSPLIDVSTVMPESVKTTISIDQSHDHGTKRYELAFNVTLCRSVFSRTKMITFVPRYQIVNLLERENLFIAQDGALKSHMCIPAQSFETFHWHNLSMSPRIRICTHLDSWSRGCIQLDKIGVTAMRIPSSSFQQPIVVQAEVRLATKREDSAVVVTIYASIEKLNPLYLLKNESQHTILCRQMLDREGAYIWKLTPGESIGFGFDDPEAPHVLEWTWSNVRRFKRTVEVDLMGSMSTLTMDDGSMLTSMIQAHQSTKVVLFSDSTVNDKQVDNYFEETVDICLRINLTGISISVIDNFSNCGSAREILLLTTEGWHASFTQRHGYHEIELRLTRLQVDNFIFNAEHPVLIFCPSSEDVPFLHLSAVRSLQERQNTLVIKYCAIRILDIDICLDRKTAETIAQFLHPLRKARDERHDVNWASSLTSKMKARYYEPCRFPRMPKEVKVQDANTGRIYLEELHLHPLRFYLTFTQEGLQWNPVTEGLVLFQLIRGMASIADAPLIFTSFVVSKAFESPSTLIGVILAHYSSQLSSQILSILGSLVMLKAPADILSNVGTGVRDFFYEPIQGLVKGPAEFLEGIESGTSSLARGVITGLVRGAASVTDLVSHNLASLTDDEFIGERNSIQRKLVHLVKTDRSKRTINDAFEVAGTFIARGIRSGATGIINQPSIYASRYGTAGLFKGVGKAIVGAILKPVVGVGDAAVVVMNHVSETTTNQVNIVKVNKRLRRALPSIASDLGKCVKITPYDESAAVAQQIITQREIENVQYLGHVQTQLFTIIVSDLFLWIVKLDTDPQRFRWAEIKCVCFVGNRLSIDFFSSPHAMSFDVSSRESDAVYELLSIKVDLSSVNKRGQSDLPGVKSNNSSFIFGNVNRVLLNIAAVELTDVSEFINKSRSRIGRLDSFMTNYFQCLDEEAWLLISFVSQAFTGLYSRRCVVVGLINGTGDDIQVLSSRLVQGGSRCYVLPTVKYDKTHGFLHPGGAIIFLGWGAAPSLLQPGNVLVHIETNLGGITLGDCISKLTSSKVLSSWDIRFLEKSYDEAEWWAKYWIVIKKKDGIAQGHQLSGAP